MNIVRYMMFLALGMLLGMLAVVAAGVVAELRRRYPLPSCIDIA